MIYHVLDFRQFLSCQSLQFVIHFLSLVHLSLETLRYFQLCTKFRICLKNRRYISTLRTTNVFSIQNLPTTNWMKLKFSRNTWSEKPMPSFDEKAGTNSSKKSAKRKRSEERIWQSGSESSEAVIRGLGVIFPIFFLRMCSCCDVFKSDVTRGPIISLWGKPLCGGALQARSATATFPTPRASPPCVLTPPPPLPTPWTTHKGWRLDLFCVGGGHIAPAVSLSNAPLVGCVHQAAKIGKSAQHSQSAEQTKHSTTNFVKFCGTLPFALPPIEHSFPTHSQWKFRITNTPHTTPPN